MTGITALGCYIPEQRQSVQEILSSRNCKHSEVRFFEKFHGLKQVSIVPAGQRLEESIRLGLQTLLDQGVTIDDADLLIYTHSSFLQVPFDHQLFAKVLGPFGLMHLRTMAVSQLYCTTFIPCLQLIERIFQREKNMRKIVLVCGDQTNYMNESRHLQEASVMGDSVACAVFEKDAADHRLLSVTMQRDTSYWRGLQLDKETRKQYNDRYMDNMIHAMETALHEAGLFWEELTYILPHNVNMTTWRQFCKKIDFDPHRIYTDLISEIGHSYCADGLLNLEPMLRSGRMRKGDTYLMVSVGLGSFMGAAVFQY